jgi:signal transduction histidine kinase
VKYTRGQPRPRITVDAEELAGHSFAIRVRDNGVGFDMRHAERLFTPFERLHSMREFEGTGMGLANVRRIVGRHGGSVNAASRPGEGATFTVVLPGAQERPSGVLHEQPAGAD